MSLFIFIPSSYSKEKTKDLPPGIFGSLKKLVDINQSVYLKKNKSLLRRVKILDELKDVKDIQIDVDFMTSLFLHTQSRYLALASEDSCHFLNLLNTQLVYSAEGPVQNLFIHYQNKKNVPFEALVSKEAFLKKVVPGNCKQIGKSRELFNKDNLLKTLEQYNTVKFTTQKECTDHHQAFIKDFKSPYVCDIYEKVKSTNRLKTQLIRTPKKNKRLRGILENQISYAERLKKKITTNQFNTIRSLCENINYPEKYCEEIFSSSFWDKISSGEKDTHYITLKCQELLGKTSIGPTDYKLCASRLNNSPEQCAYINKDYPALLPKPNCNEIATALNYSRIFSQYNDCPGRMGNESISNIGRIIRHFTKDKGSPDGYCFTDTSHAFAKLNLEADNEKSWGTHFCYFDKIRNTEVCHPTVIGNVSDSNLDQGRVLVSILNRTKGLSSETKCKVIPSIEYNPAILKYKTGCYITTEPNCLASHCGLKVYYQEKPQDGFSFSSQFNFGYLTNEINQEQYSQLKVLERQLQKKNKAMLNTTFIKNILDEHAEALVHGIGCAEDILPHFFKKTTFNQCSPLPFIIDGYKEKNGFFTFVVRTSFDDINSPRLIEWSYIFTSVKNYQALHPLNTWSLHATY